MFSFIFPIPWPKQRTLPEHWWWFRTWRSAGWCCWGWGEPFSVPGWHSQGPRGCNLSRGRRQGEKLHNHGEIHCCNFEEIVSMQMALKCPYNYFNTKPLYEYIKESLHELTVIITHQTFPRLFLSRDLPSCWADLPYSDLHPLGTAACSQSQSGSAGFLTRRHLKWLWW